MQLHKSVCHSFARSRQLNNHKTTLTGKRDLALSDIFLTAECLSISFSSFLNLLAISFQTLMKRSSMTSNSLRRAASRDYLWLWCFACIAFISFLWRFINSSDLLNNLLRESILNFSLSINIASLIFFLSIFASL